MIQWSGLKAYKQKLKRAPDKLGRKSRQDVERFGRAVESKAQADAPVDLGKLRQSINYEPINSGYGAKISVNVPYAAFVEFGTGAGVLIPPGWEEIAQKWRGNNKREVTITAHPYFIPAVRSETEKLKARLRYNLRTFLQ